MVPTGFPAALGDSQHVRILPAAHTYNSDVETVHRLIEDEFFDLETFASRTDFLAKATVYQLYTSTWCGPTATRAGSLPGRSFSSSSRSSR
jgi:hypothetical protein